MLPATVIFEKIEWKHASSELFSIGIIFERPLHIDTTFVDTSFNVSRSTTFYNFSSLLRFWSLRRSTDRKVCIISSRAFALLSIVIVYVQLILLIKFLLIKRLIILMIQKLFNHVQASFDFVVKRILTHIQNCGLLYLIITRSVISIAFFDGVLTLDVWCTIVHIILYLVLFLLDVPRPIVEVADVRHF